MTHWTDKLKDPCPDGLAWARGSPTAQAAWDACENADWMLWLLRKTEREDDLRFRAFALECARSVAHLGPPVCRETLDVVERHLVGEATGEELRAAWAAALAATWAAAGDAAGAAARDASWAAGDASWAAGDAAWAAAVAAAGAAAWAAAWVASWAAAGAAQCHLIRSFWPEVPL